MQKLYIYVIDRDFGFAPNPFHGYCTLATCKPRIRSKAELGDWVMGVGGSRLRATGRCVFAMRVSETLSFNEFWSTSKFFDKRPVRNGSSKMMVGDNIYRRDEATGVWTQADSHHSNADGQPNLFNLSKDTGIDRVLVSDHFYYFGKHAPEIPARLLQQIGYRNCRSYRVFELSACADLMLWLRGAFSHSLNCVAGDPFDFEQSGKRYSARDNSIR